MAKSTISMAMFKFANCKRLPEGTPFDRSFHHTSHLSTSQLHWPKIHPTSARIGRGRASEAWQILPEMRDLPPAFIGRLMKIEMLYRLYLWIYDMYGFSPVFEEKIVKDPPGWRRMATQHLFRFQLLHKARSADVAIPDAAATWWITMPATFLCTNVKNIFLRGGYLGIVLSSTKLKCSVIWGFLLPIMVRSLWGRYIPGKP